MDKLKAGNFKVKPYFTNDDLVSPTPSNIVIMKEDAVTGAELRGFESEESAYEDFLKDQSTVAPAPATLSLSDFVKDYLDGEQSTNSAVWKRAQPDDKGAAEAPKTSGKVVMEEEHVGTSPEKLKSEESS